MEMRHQIQGSVTVLIWILTVAMDKVRNLLVLGAGKFKKETASGIGGSRGSTLS